VTRPAAGAEGRRDHIAQAQCGASGQGVHIWGFGGFQLGRVQQGLEPNNYRPMPSIGPGVKEIKLQDEGKNQYRLIYVAKFEEAIYVFHVITKKTTETTSKHDIALAQRRLSEIIQHRQASTKK
jgi:phage-related protein